MHTTTIILKDGRTFAGPIRRFKPEQGYIQLTGTDEVLFSDCASITTEGERFPDQGQGTGKVDELARARAYLQKARSRGWDGMTQDTPLPEWATEKEAKP